MRRLGQWLRHLRRSLVDVKRVVHRRPQHLQRIGRQIARSRLGEGLNDQLDRLQIGTVSLPITAAIAAEREFLVKDDLVGFFGIGSGLNCLMLGLKW